jgi:hypothetical protein
MQARVDLPKAFSVRDENEFYPIQHLMARLNAKLMVRHAGTGRHANGGPTVWWGLVHLDGQPLTKKEVETALKDAGYDFGCNGLSPGLWDAETEEAKK